jgi:hypothetical protein
LGLKLIAMPSKTARLKKNGKPLRCSKYRSFINLANIDKTNLLRYETNLLPSDYKREVRRYLELELIPEERSMKVSSS